MSAILLARIQFALTISFHYIFPPLSIGLAWIIFYFLWGNLRESRKDNASSADLYLKSAKYWIKLFTITFAVGVATGITMEFQFGTNWAQYSRFVGDIFGAPLAAEALMAFFLESCFLGILLYGEKRVSPKVYCFSALMVAVGATISAFWIVVANSWQQTPTGYHLVNGRAELLNFWDAIFNPSTIPRFLHTIGGALSTGAFFVLGISAYYLRRAKFKEFAKKSFSVGILFSMITSWGMLFLGHHHTVQVYKTQPLKLAAFEGLWESRTNAPLLLFGIPNEKEHRTDYAITIPSALSFLVAFDSKAPVSGLNDFPKENYPPLITTFITFHLMVILGVFMIIFSTVGFLLWKLSPDAFLGEHRKKYADLFLKIAFWSIPVSFIANQLGWAAAEVGRQPWVVYNLLKTSDSVSVSVPASHILASIILFSVIYSLLFILWIFFLRLKVNKGPEV
ncbi:MAG: cytochrome ubiquinol oxidase subunit I [Oligoflexia bacterium]|nr:cytochrome ubiquinol oxidase subunit I [Oligoflexia bacterium]